MSDEEEDAEPAVELGEHTPVEGAPLARVTSRMNWPVQKSEVDRLEGDSVIRTPEGARSISDVLEEIDETYFERRQEFEEYVREVIGSGPVAVAESGDTAGGASAPSLEDDDASDEPADE